MKRNNSSSKKKSLDAIDCQMIELLQKDGRISNTDIAKEIGLSEATVRTRLNRLIQDEVIQIVAVSNPIKLGFKIVGNIRIQFEDLPILLHLGAGALLDQSAPLGEGDDAFALLW